MYEYEQLPIQLSSHYIDTIDKIITLQNELNLKENSILTITNDDIFDSTKIEGNALSKNEVTYYIENDITIRGKKFKDFAQVDNYKTVLDIVKQMVKNNNFELSEDLILHIHQMATSGELPPTECGVYRDDYVHIRGTNYIPPNHYEIEEDIKNLIYHYKYDITPVFDKICEFKRNFERIHPFFDGNGRTGRVLMNLLFLSNGYGYIHILESERDIYFSAIENNTLHEFLADKMVTTLEHIKHLHEMEIKYDL